jgi:hypothetical protein
MYNNDENKQIDEFDTTSWAYFEEKHFSYIIHIFLHSRNIFRIQVWQNNMHSWTEMIISTMYAYGIIHQVFMYVIM